MRSEGIWVWVAGAVRWACSSSGDNGLRNVWLIQWRCSIRCGCKVQAIAQPVRLSTLSWCTIEHTLRDLAEEWPRRRMEALAVDIVESLAFQSGNPRAYLRARMQQLFRHCIAGDGAERGRATAQLLRPHEQLCVGPC